MKKRKKGIISKSFSIIYLAILLTILYKLYGTYRTYYFNDFERAERTLGISSFRRDFEETYSGETGSYRIQSPEFNDAVFYKTIEVEPNTPYRVTCMVKTENIKTEQENSDAGATICIIDSAEISESITGTNNWQQLEFIFNSKNRESVKIGFRLGGNICLAKGTAWFSDFKVEKGERRKQFYLEYGMFYIQIHRCFSKRREHCFKYDRWRYKTDKIKHGKI